MEKYTYSILIVDDDRDDHLFLKTALRQVIPGAVVKSCYDGGEALIYLNTCPTLPQLVFMDLNMGKVSGKTTTAMIRKKEKLNGMPLIILTTSNNQGERNELLNMGASDYYTKPCSIPELVSIVQHVKNNWLKQIN